MDLENLTKKQKILITGILLIIVLFGIYYFSNSREEILNDSSDNELVEGVYSESTGDSSYQYVEITGQVLSPGVYEVKKELMVIELIDLAGGLTEYADLESVHKDISLSSIVEQRQKIYIPALPIYTNGSKGTSGSTKPSADNKVSINSATIDQLDSLPDVGPATANKIISSRPYKTLEDLKEVEGIGEKTYNNIVSLITL